MACSHCNYSGRVWVAGRGYVRCYCEKPNPSYAKATARNALASQIGREETYGFGVAVRAAGKFFDVGQLAEIAHCSRETIRKALGAQMSIEEGKTNGDNQ